jgi:D-arabinose 1-dehydrogenase-like Zn-dependent alcohol dehydrogenase
MPLAARVIRWRWSSADFEEAFRAVSDGRGVDVVLNSLAGDYVDASLRLLADEGRFAEMGKSDRRSATDVSAAHPHVAVYQVFELVEAGPDRIGQMLAELLRLFQAGALTPLPLTTWGIRQAPEALRFMSQARHIGKIVLTMPRSWDPDGTVLIVGGTGGLGGMVARHVVAQHGVRHVLLASRSGEQADGAAELVAELAALGARVKVAACDAADRDEVRRLLSSVPQENPLTAVVHTAGVLDDGLIGRQSSRRIDMVLRPKLDAAWYLHELTAGMDLAAFVLFSSAQAHWAVRGRGTMLRRILRWTCWPSTGRTSRSPRSPWPGVCGSGAAG